jgi:PhzF family phenazine biosynthesis protein
VTRSPLFQLDAFTNRRFAGNPAAVMPMRAFPPDRVMQAIAAENNLSETAFVVAEATHYALRWFTPLVEVPLCGHATLASAAVVMERLEPGRTEVAFHTHSGVLAVRRTARGYAMDFPARRYERVAPPPGLAQAISATPIEVLADPFNYAAVLARADDVRRLVPDLSAIARLDRSGLVVTARGDGPYDCVSRYFAPAKGIPEDPVTGGAHCMLAPYWADRLGTPELFAYQASARGGELRCVVRGDRVELAGECVFYFEGEADWSSAGSRGSDVVTMPV